MAPVERSDLRSAAYTLLLRHRSGEPGTRALR
jgi:hypothetical protein